MEKHDSQITYLTYWMSEPLTKILIDKYYRSEVYKEVTSVRFNEINNQKSSLRSKLMSSKGLPPFHKIVRTEYTRHLDKNSDVSQSNSSKYLLVTSMQLVTQLLSLCINLSFLRMCKVILFDKRIELKLKKNSFIKNRILYLILPINSFGMGLFLMPNQHTKSLESEYAIQIKKYKKIL